jgi:glycosyltransferase involved in cell wall biosynthesis
MVLPTYSENFGIVVAEAFMVEPVTTKGTPWEDLETYNAAGGLS